MADDIYSITGCNPRSNCLRKTYRHHLYFMARQVSFLVLYSFLVQPIPSLSNIYISFSRCGSRGNCLEYDNEKLIYVTAAVATVSKFFTILFFVLAWKMLKPLPPTVEMNGNGGVNYRSPDITNECDTTLVRSANVWENVYLYLERVSCDRVRELIVNTHLMIFNTHFVICRRILWSWTRILWSWTRILWWQTRILWS